MILKNIMFILYIIFMFIVTDNFVDKIEDYYQIYWIWLLPLRGLLGYWTGYSSIKIFKLP